MALPNKSRVRKDEQNRKKPFSCQKCQKSMIGKTAISLSTCAEI
jgi:ribosomal protein L37AE/L43A